MSDPTKDSAALEARVALLREDFLSEVNHDALDALIAAVRHATIAECVEAVKGAGDCCDECMDAARDAAVLVLRGLETTP